MFFGNYYEWTSFASICSLPNTDIEKLRWSSLDEACGIKNKLLKQRAQFQQYAREYAQDAEENIMPSLSEVIADLNSFRKKSVVMHKLLRS